MKATNAKDCGDNELDGEQLRMKVWLRNEEASASFGFPFLPQKVRGQREVLIGIGDASAMCALLSLLRVAVSAPSELRDLVVGVMVDPAGIGTGERHSQPVLSDALTSAPEADAASGNDKGKESAHGAAHAVATEIVSWRNELAAMQLLSRVVRRQIAAYPATMEADRATLRGGGYGLSSNGINAIRLVAGEKHVLKHIEQVARIASSHLQEVGRLATSETAEMTTNAVEAQFDKPTDALLLGGTPGTRVAKELPVSDEPPPPPPPTPAPNCLLDMNLYGLNYRQLLGYLLTRTFSLAVS